MAIHYLMNVANPPLVPNIQAVPRSFPGHMKATNINGYDVRFLNDESEPRKISSAIGVLVTNNLLANFSAVSLHIMEAEEAVLYRVASTGPTMRFQFGPNMVSFQNTRKVGTPQDRSQWKSTQISTCHRRPFRA